MSRPAGTTLSTPGGSPASSAASAMRKASSTVSGAGLSTTVLPAASAGPSLRNEMAWGTFHGTIAATTPIGSRPGSDFLPSHPAGPSPRLGATRGAYDRDRH